MADDLEAYYDPLEELAGGKAHPLLEACKSGDYKGLVKLINDFKAKEKPLRVCDLSGWQAVHFAAKLSDPACLLALLKHDESLVHSCTKDQVTPLIVAAGMGNVRTASEILHLLDSDDVCDQDIHGLNALYYAVKCNTEQGTQIALSLLSKNNERSTIQCLATFDGVPMRVIKNKNRKIFSAILNADLDLGFDCLHPNNRWPASAPRFFDNRHFNDCDAWGLGRDVLDIAPCSLFGYTVKENWVEGLEMLIRTHKKRRRGIRRDAVRSQLRKLFTCTAANNRAGQWKFYGSAWTLVFYTGNRECLDVMMREGMTLNAHPDVVVKLLFQSDLAWLDPKFPLTVCLANNLWEKRKFIKYILSLQSCLEFDQHYNKCIIRYERAIEHAEFGDVQVANTVRDFACYRHHPIEAVAGAIVEECATGLHTIDETVEMLVDCGFSFDWRIAICFNSKGYRRNMESIRNQSLVYNWCDTISVLLHLSIIDYKIFPVLMSISNHFPNLPFKMFAVAQACNVSLPKDLKVPGSSCPQWPHLSIMKLLARIPPGDLIRCWYDIEIVQHAVVTSQSFVEYTYDYTKEHTEVNDDWFIAMQLLLKGVPVRNLSIWGGHYLERGHALKKDKLPFSLLFMTDGNKRKIMDQFDSWQHQYEGCFKDPVFSNLQSRCRKVIRDQIGFSRLIREPVPRIRDRPYEVTPDESWEVSSIDSLSIPTVLKDFLRFKEEIIQYVSYLTKYDISSAQALRLLYVP